ncbi:MAG TPA: restriction endonuclease subunit S [Agitococcus sp.]|nr:restriction endonuclease subunit S [Agitococcus sp.]
MEISKSQLASILIKIPTLPEQTAIANILTNMDNDIQTLQNKLTKAKQIKQGMMQELLTGKTRLI